jgi:SAM-dependent methyltransferase
VPDGFDRVGPGYEAAVARSIRFAGRPHDVYTRAKVDALLRLARQRLTGTPARALDVGCGIGLADRHLMPYVDSLHGVDVSEAMVEQARLRNPGVEYRFYDGSVLPYDSEQFDLVFAICVLHHVEPEARGALLRELRRVARPGGLIAVFEHNPRNPLTRRVVHTCAAGVDVTDEEYLLVFPWRARLLQALERRLARVPLGAQYVVAGRPTS